MSFVQDANGPELLRDSEFRLNIDEEKEKIFMEKVKRQMLWFTSSVVAVDHSMMNWRAQVIHNFELLLQRFYDDADRHDIEVRRCELIARIYHIRTILRDVLRARDAYIEVVKQQKIDRVALDNREWRYVRFCTDIMSKLDCAKEQVNENLKPALKELEKENGYPGRVQVPEYRGRESPLSFARRELGFIA